MQESSRELSRSSRWAAVLFALVLPTFVTLAYFIWAESFDSSVQRTTYGVAKTIQFGFPILWGCWICRQRLRLRPKSLKGVLLGVIFGLLVAVAMFAIYHGWLKSSELLAGAMDDIQQKILGMGLKGPWKFILLGVFYSLIHSLLEEYYWRWFVFGQLKELVRFWPAVIISSLGFMAHHVIVLGEYVGGAYLGMGSIETWLASVPIAIGGAFWAWLYQRSGSLFGPWLSHLLVDAAIFAIGYNIVRELL